MIQYSAVNKSIQSIMGGKSQLRPHLRRQNKPSYSPTTIGLTTSKVSLNQGYQTNALRYVVYDVVAPYLPYVRSPLYNRTIYYTVVEALIIL